MYRSRSTYDTLEIGPPNTGMCWPLATRKNSGIQRFPVSIGVIFCCTNYILRDRNINTSIARFSVAGGRLSELVVCFQLAVR